MRCKFHLFTLLLCTALLGCKSNEYHSDSFDYSHSVDLSYILQAYDWQQKYEGEDETTILWSKIVPEIPEQEFYLFEDTSFVLRVPEYANSKQPFLANAEDFYNSCAISWNIYSNFEVWYRGNTTDLLRTNDDVKRATKNIRSVSSMTQKFASQHRTSRTPSCC